MANIQTSQMAQIEDYAKRLSLPVLRVEYKSIMKEATLQSWSFEKLLLYILSREVERRDENGIKQRIYKAGFPQTKYLQELLREELPENARNVLPEIETLDFIRQGRNIVMYGNPGTGKTHLAIALGIKACNEGFNVFYSSVPHLITLIRECKSRKTLHLLEKKFEKYDLVICDEFGYVSCDKEGGELLFNHLSLRTGKHATIITTNLSFDRWGEIIRDKVLVTAMVDRITHKSFLINMNGESYRLKETQRMMKKILSNNKKNSSI